MVGRQNRTVTAAITKNNPYTIAAALADPQTLYSCVLNTGIISTAIPIPESDPTDASIVISANNSCISFIDSAPHILAMAKDRCLLKAISIN